LVNQSVGSFVWWLALALPAVCLIETDFVLLGIPIIGKFLVVPMNEEDFRADAVFSTSTFGNANAINEMQKAFGFPLRRGDTVG
jgi:hypothetical protein